MKSIKDRRIKFNGILDVRCNTRILIPYFIALVFLPGLELSVSNIFFNPTYGQIEITTDENLTPPIFNNAKTEDAQPDLTYYIPH